MRRGLSFETGWPRRIQRFQTVVRHRADGDRSPCGHAVRHRIRAAGHRDRCEMDCR